MSDLQKLKESILEDGIIDFDEVEKLKKIIYEDGKIDEEEANFLFELNDAVSGKDNDPSWNKLIVEAITKYVLEDENSPGVVDESEAKWLIDKIQSDDKIDETEKLILINIKKNAKSIPNSLQTFIEGL